MTEYDTLLSTSLKEINDKFLRVKQDLVDEVAQLGESVKRVAEGARCSLDVSPRLETMDGSIFSLRLNTKAGGALLGEYLVPQSGYPISFGRQEGNKYEEFRVQGRLEDREAIRQHFKEMLANQASPLVIQLAYALRRW